MGLSKKEVKRRLDARRAKRKAQERRATRGMNREQRQAYGAYKRNPEKYMRQMGRTGKAAGSAVLNKIRQGDVRREDSFSPSQLMAAQHELTRQQSQPDRYAQQKADLRAKREAGAGDRRAASEKYVQEQGGLVNGIPVMVDSSGNVKYDIQKAGEMWGMDQKDIDLAMKTQFGQRTESTQSALSGMMKGGSGARQKTRQYTKAQRALRSEKDPRAAILNNMSNLDPRNARVDLTKPDHIRNLSRAGSFSQTRYGEKDVRDAIGEGAGPTGFGKYAPGAIAGLASLVNPWMGAGMKIAMSAGEAGQGDMSWGDVAKGAATSIAGAYLGGQFGAGGHTGGAFGGGTPGAWSALGNETLGTIGGAALRGGLQGGGTALAGEGVGAAFGDDFDAGQVAQATATGAAMGGAKQVAQEGFAGLKDSMGIGAPDTAGDSLTPSEQFEGAQGQFGGQQGMEGTGQFTSDTPQYDLNVGGIEGAGIYEPSGAGMIGGIGAPQGNIGDEMAPLTVEPVGPTPGVARPAMMPWGHTALQTTPQGTAQVTPLTSGNVEATLGPDVVGMATDMGSFFDPYSDIGAAEADFGEEIARQKGLDTTVSPLAGTAESGLMGGAGIEGPLQPGRWAEQPAVDEGINYQSLLGGFSGLASGLFGGETSGGGGGAQTSRQAQDLGVDTSEAGQEDPVSALQIQSTGMASLNPALFNWVGGDDPQEMKKRVQMWQNNPNITDF